MTRTRSEGFTLVETLIALLILAVALIAVYRVLGATTVATGRLQLHQVGDWVAADRLAELRVTGAWPNLGNGQGRTVQAGHTLLWRQQVLGTPNPLFRRVDISVYTLDDNQHAIARLSGFVVRPLQ
jgi:general secretion pathway protein I